MEVQIMKAVAPRLVSKFVSIYDKLFNGLTAEDIYSHEPTEQFWSNLLSLEVDQRQLGRKFREVSKDELLTRLKVSPYLSIHAYSRRSTSKAQYNTWNFFQ